MSKANLILRGMKINEDAKKRKVSESDDIQTRLKRIQDTAGKLLAMNKDTGWDGRDKLIDQLKVDADFIHMVNYGD